MGGWGGQNVSPAIPYADKLLLNLNYTSPPSFIQIGPKLPKFLTWSGQGGWLGWVKHGPDTLCFFLVVSLQK